MKTKFYIGGIVVISILIFLFVWSYQRQSERSPQVSALEQPRPDIADKKSEDKRDVWKKELVEILPQGAFEMLDGEEKERFITNYGRRQEIDVEQLIQETDASIRSTDEMLRRVFEKVRKSQDRLALWNANRSQREADAENRRLETEAIEREHEMWRDKMLEIGHPIDDFVSNMPHSEPSHPEQNDIKPSEMQTPTFTAAQHEFNKFRDGLEDTYFDVVASQYLNPREFDKYFPTPQDRANLTRRTSEMQKLVVSQVREIVKDIPNASAEQKRAFVRDLVRQNWSRDFAESVLKQLSFDEK